jgi:hypothetical protein
MTTVSKVSVDAIDTATENKIKHPIAVLDLARQLGSFSDILDAPFSIE